MPYSTDSTDAFYNGFAKKVISMSVFNDLSASFPMPGTPPRKLPLKCKPFPGESLNSLVMRLAERNGGIKPSELARGTLRGFPTLSLDAEESLRFSVWAQLPTDKVFRLCFPDSPRVRGVGPKLVLRSFMGQVLAPHDFTTSRRVCVACLMENGFEPRIWSVGELEGCTIHDVPFISRCPSCRSDLTFDGPITACSCGQRFDRITPEEWRPESRAVTAYIAGRLLGSGPSIPRLDAVRLTDAIALIRCFGLFSLTGPQEELFALIRSGSVRNGWCAGPGHILPELPGLAAPFREAIAALVREAAGYRLPPGDVPMDAITASEAALRRRDEARVGIEWFGADGFDYDGVGRVWKVTLSAGECWFARGGTGRLLGPFAVSALGAIAIMTDMIGIDRSSNTTWAPSDENLEADCGWRAQLHETASAINQAILHKITGDKIQPFWVVSDRSGIREEFKTEDLAAAMTEVAREVADETPHGMSAADVRTLWQS